MLDKEWFDPEMPTKEFMLGVYEWVSDVEALGIAAARMEVLQDAAEKDPEFAAKAVYALVYYPENNPHNLACTNRVNDRDRSKYPDSNYPSLLDLQNDGKEMYADYLTWIADPKQVEKDLAQIAEEEQSAWTESQDRCLEQTPT